jgi:hypothetical protein
MNRINNMKIYIAKNRKHDRVEKVARSSNSSLGRGAGGRGGGARRRRGGNSHRNPLKRLNRLLKKARVGLDRPACDSLRAKAAARRDSHY